MHEIPISSQGPKGVNAQFLEDAERNAAYFSRFEPGCFMCVGPSSEKTWTSEKKTDMTHQENEMCLHDKSLKYILYQNIQSLKDADNFPKGDEARWQKHKPRCMNLISGQSLIARCFVEFVIILDKKILNVARIGLHYCSCSKSLGKCLSVSCICC